MEFYIYHLDRKCVSKSTETRAQKITRSPMNTVCEEFHLIDCWRPSDPNRRRYTGIYYDEKIANRLDYFLISDNPVDEIAKCNIQASTQS